MTVDDLLGAVERRRAAATPNVSEHGRVGLGQVFTPRPVAEFLASLFDLPTAGTLRLLDPGAGLGALTCAVVARVLRERPNLRLELTAFEIDLELHPILRETLEDCVAAAEAAGASASFEIREDFVGGLSDQLDDVPSFTACVMNPPYRKVNLGDAEREALGRRGVRVTNLYAAFVAAAIELLEDGAQLVAITPRSFANGPYFASFRRFFLDRMTFDQLHVYEKRGAVFGESNVLQENVVFRATRRTEEPSTVIVSSSVDALDDPRVRDAPYAAVVQRRGNESVVHLPINDDDAVIARYVAELPATLSDLGVTVSTGRVVDFRNRPFLRARPDRTTVPLIYPHHLQLGRIAWPGSSRKKPTAIVASAETDALRLPNETYVVVKRFTAKEEKRRVVASVSSPQDLPGESVAFENHLNVFHAGHRGLPVVVAHGIAAFLNSSVVDAYVRQFSGHTQINATDLRALRYPAADDLAALGTEIVSRGLPSTQVELDVLVSDHVEAFAEIRTALAA